MYLSRRALAAGTAALLITGATLVGAGGVASAQNSPGQGGQNCRNAQDVYPQGANRGQGAGVNNNGQARRGENARGNTGCSQFAPGRRVAVSAESTPIPVGIGIADEGGAVTIDFIVPTALADGRHDLVFTDLVTRSNVVRVPFNVVGGPTSAGAGQGAGGAGQGAGGAGQGAGGAGQGAGGAGQGSALPRTGSDQLVPLTITGLALVGIGASVVVAARRRRETAMPTGLA